jgi:hypothetical protein
MMSLEYLSSDKSINWIETKEKLEEISIYDYSCIVESDCGRYSARAEVSCGEIERVYEIELIDE